MTNQMLKLTRVALMLLLTSNIYADDAKKEAETNAKPNPVDEGVKTVATKDSVKGGDKLKDNYKYKKLSLSKIDKVHQIKRENLNFPPYRCFIYHSGGKQTEIGVMNSSLIQFSVDKSKLSVGDTILVTNKLTVVSKSPIKKFIIEEFEIIE